MGKINNKEAKQERPESLPKFLPDSALTLMKIYTILSKIGKRLKMNQSSSDSFFKRINILSLLALCSFGFLCFVLGVAYLHRYPKDNIFANSVHALRTLKNVYFPANGYGDTITTPRVPEKGVTIYLPNKADNGFTLYSTEKSPLVYLIDMKGNVVHTWDLSATGPIAHSRGVIVDDAQLTSNGELVAVVTSDYDAPWGLGVVKLDRNSKIEWFYHDKRAHHRLSIGEDHKIYTLTHKFVNSSSEWATKELGSPILEDSITILNSNGKEMKSFAILDAIKNSKFRDIVDILKARGKLDDDPYLNPYEGDYTHINTVKYITKEQAEKFPFAHEGDVLVSMRNMDLIAVIDVNKEVATWVAFGPWHKQHEPTLLSNGNLLIFDNRSQWPKSRVIEYNPKTQQIVWEYSGTEAKPLQTDWFGKAQVLKNQDILITETNGGRLLEITRDSEIVWEFSNPQRVKDTGETFRINFGYRYYPDELNFLDKKGEGP